MMKTLKGSDRVLRSDLNCLCYKFNIGAKKGKMEYSEKNRTNDMQLEGKKVGKAYSYQNIDNEKIT